MKTMSDEKHEPDPESADDIGTAAPGEKIKCIVEARAHGWRVDHYLARLYPNCRVRREKRDDSTVAEEIGFAQRFARSKCHSKSASVGL